MKAIFYSVLWWFFLSCFWTLKIKGILDNQFDQTVVIHKNNLDRKVSPRRVHKFLISTLRCGPYSVNSIHKHISVHLHRLSLHFPYEHIYVLHFVHLIQPSPDSKVQNKLLQKMQAELSSLFWDFSKWLWSVIRASLFFYQYFWSLKLYVCVLCCNLTGGIQFPFRIPEFLKATLYDPLVSTAVLSRFLFVLLSSSFLWALWIAHISFDEA